MIKAGAPLPIPSQMRFEFVANKERVDETVACFGAERDLMPVLPNVVVGTDFEDLPVTSLGQARDAYRRAAGNDYVEGTFNVNIR